MTENDRAIEGARENASPEKDRCSMPLSEQTRAAVRAWAKQQPDQPTLSEAVERLVKTGVTD